MKPGRAYKMSGAIAAAVAVGVSAIIFFQVRELLAALLILGVLFAAASLGFFVLFLFEELAVIVMNLLEAGVAHLRFWHSGAIVHSGKGHLLRNSRWN